MNLPSSQDILATLIELLADQENVKITYEFVECKTRKEINYE